MVVKLLTIPMIYKAKFKFEVNLAPITIAKTALCNSEWIDLFSFLVIVSASLKYFEFLAFGFLCRFIFFIDLQLVFYQYIKSVNGWYVLIVYYLEDIIIFAIFLSSETALCNLFNLEFSLLS